MSTELNGSGHYLFKTFPSVLHKFPCRRLRVSNEEGLVEVTMVATMVHGHIDIDNVTVLKTKLKSRQAYHYHIFTEHPRYTGVSVSKQTETPVRIPRLKVVKNSKIGFSQLLR
jgi:hypothetical protein